MKVLRKVKGKSRILIFVAVVVLLSLALRKVRTRVTPAVPHRHRPLDNELALGCQPTDPFPSPHLPPHSQLKQDTMKHREILPWHQGGYEDHHGDLDGGFVPDRGVVGAMRGGGERGGTRDDGGNEPSDGGGDGDAGDASGGHRDGDDVSHLVHDDDDDALGVKDEAFANMRGSREKSSR